MISLSKNIIEVSYYKNKIYKNLSTDSYEECADKSFYLNYSKKIDYKFNSRGFRDNEWPKDLSDVIWCIGDSATLGVGLPFDQIWPQILQKRLNKRCINISELGSSNDTIALRAKEIIKKFKPKKLIILWSFFHRRRKKDTDILVDKQDYGVLNDLKNFQKNFFSVNNFKKISIINLVLPNPLTGIVSNQVKDNLWKRLLIKNNLFTKKETEKIIDLEQIDWARDYMHFGNKTNQMLCDKIIKNFKS